MDRGVEPVVAIELERAVVGDAPVEATSETLTARGLAEAAGAPSSFVRRMIETRLLVPLPGEKPSFDATDVRLVRVAHSLAEATGLDLSVATRISDAVRELSCYEMALRNEAVAGRDEAASFEITLRIQQAVHLVHAYLFYRWRLHDIAELQRQEALAQKGES